MSFNLLSSLENEDFLLKIEKELNKNNIFPRRYFYPSVNTYTNIYKYQSCPISEDISKGILCLPLFYNLDINSIEKICKIIINTL